MAEAQEADTNEDCLDALLRSLEPNGERLTREFSAFVADTPSGSWSEKVANNAKTVIFDTFGVALAASGRAVGQTITRYATEAGPAPAVATILGGNMHVSPEMAALANGTLANALDFNESSHIATHVLPAILSLAERDCRSGKDVLDAFVVGFEAGTRFAECFDSARADQQGPTYRGWWHVGLAGPIAAAMAASRMLGLSRDETATAIGIASSSCGGFRRNMGSMAKALHSGNAARAGASRGAAGTKGIHG